jgi:hypothetical protein
VHNKYGIFQGCSHVFLFWLFVVLPLCSVCFRKSVPCLVCVVCRWRYLCYILLHICGLCILFGMIALSDLCIAGDSLCILVCIHCRCHICYFFVFLVVGVSVWCWLFWRLFWCQGLWIFWQFFVFHVRSMWMWSIYFVGWYFLWCDLGLLQCYFCIVLVLWTCLFGNGSVVVCTLFYSLMLKYSIFKIIVFEDGHHVIYALSHPRGL